MNASLSTPVAAFEAIMFVFERDEAGLRGLVANQLLVAAHDNQDYGGNQWCFYVSVGANQFVMINPISSGVPGPTIPGGTKSTMVVSTVSLDGVQQAKHVTSLPVHPLIQVGHFVDVITGAGRHRYQFEANGRGSQRWVTDQIDLFVSMGLVTGSFEVEKAKRDILADWLGSMRTKPTMPLNMNYYY